MGSRWTERAQSGGLITLSADRLELGPPWRAARRRRATGILGLNALVRHSYAVVIRKPPAQEAGHAHDGEPDDTQDQRAHRRRFPVIPRGVAPDEVDDEDRQRSRVERRVEPSSAEGAGAVRQVQVVDNAPDRGECGTHRTEEG